MTRSKINNLIISDGLFYSQINQIEKILKYLDLWQYSKPFPRFPKQYLSDISKKSYSNTWLYLYKNDYYNFLLNDNSLIIFYQSIKKLSFSFYVGPDDVKRQDQDSLVFSEYPTPVRYDFDEKGASFTHPESHFHIGFNSEIRIGCEILINPLSFLFFILRQFYPKAWTIFQVHKNFKSYLSSFVKSKKVKNSNKNLYELFLKKF